MSLAKLALFAVSAANNTASRTPVYAMSVEEARSRVIIKDANKQPNENGSQSLSVYLSKIRMSLDVVSPGAGKINATVDQITEFTDILQAAVDDGSFDEAIVEAQGKAKAQAEKAAASKAANLTLATEDGESVPSDTPEVDLSSLDVG